VGWSARTSGVPAGVAGAIARAAVVLGLVAPTLGGAPAPATAHANLTSASPEPQSTTNGSPSQVQLHFGWPAVPDDRTRVSVIVPSGRDIAVGTAVASGLGVSQRLSPSREKGWYRVRFTVAFVDGHAGSGVFRFRVGTRDASAPATAPWKWASVGLGTVFLGYVLALARRRERPAPGVA
jgi:copper transport protein